MKFIYSYDNKRYHSYDYYLQTKFGGKTAKIPIDAGLPCPHDGCVFCGGYGNRYGGEIRSQFDRKAEALSDKWVIKNYIAYFQYGTNTNAPVGKLRELYEPVLRYPNVVGIDIATRPDCLDDGKIAYLQELSQRTVLTVELGLQTANDDTAILINRGYSLKVFEQTYHKLRGAGIDVCIHIINSLPGEGERNMLDTARYIANLSPLPYGLKIHMLSVIKGTKLETMRVNLLTREEYIDITVKQLEFLPPQIVMLRLTGDPDTDILIEPWWLTKKFTILNDINKELIRRGTYQGRLTGYTAVSKEPPKIMTNILSMAKRLLDVAVIPNGVYIDFTMGNGNDTAYLSKAVESGKVYAFDIQREAIDNTRKRLDSENCPQNYTLILDSHENFDKYIDGKINGGIFNLGYRPAGDKSITTKKDSTLKTVEKALDRLEINGVIVIVIYPGHNEGMFECDALTDFTKDLDKKTFDVLYHRLINVAEAPFIIAVQKK